MKGEAAGRELLKRAKKEWKRGDQIVHLITKETLESLRASKSFESLKKYLPDSHDSIKVINDFISPLGEYPHAYVLACIMDRQIKAERVWIIPYLIYKKLGDRFGINELYGMSKDDFDKIFQDISGHRFKSSMAEYFMKAVKRLHDVYDGDASKIWNDNPSSATLVCRFLEFKGVGRKIATMAANILYRQFGIKLKDARCIDVSPDVHIQRVFNRLGLVGNDGGKVDIEQVIYAARDLNPKYPGVVDYTCWNIGRNFCDPRPEKAKCDKCHLRKECNKLVLNVDKKQR